MIATIRSGAPLALSFFAFLLLLQPLAAQQVTMTTDRGPRAPLFVAPAPRPMSFLDRQLAFPRVRGAWLSKADHVTSLFRAQGIETPVEVLFRVFKREQVLEVWARDRDSREFTRINVYPICKLSGRLGPKRRQGDLQIPEGFYSIDAFNPWSDYHLSMRVSYPNAVDRARRTAAPLGGDIFIHGGCATIGCVPVGNQWIEELYVIAAQLRDAGQERIPVHIFPTRLDERGMSWLVQTYGRRFVDLPFWRNLQEGYALFERTRALPDVVMEDGRYAFMSAPKVDLATSF